jgi:peptidoglycan hydrolase-like protein with peptidoglycan-binding domain
MAKKIISTAVLLQFAVAFVASAQLINLPPLNGSAGMQTQTTATASSTTQRDLGMGMRGDDVKAVQTFLISRGHLAAGLDTGFYGELTMQGVKKFQAANGLPTTGFFGSMTRAKVGAILGVGIGTGTSTGGVTQTDTIMAEQLSQAFRQTWQTVRASSPNAKTSAELIARLRTRWHGPPTFDEAYSQTISLLRLINQEASR